MDDPSARVGKEETRRAGREAALRAVWAAVATGLAAAITALAGILEEDGEVAVAAAASVAAGVTLLAVAARGSVSSSAPR